MPGIEWVNTVDNRSFVQGMNEMQASFRRTSEILKSIGQNFNIDGIANQYISLTKVIQDNEAAIRKSRESVLRWQEEAQKARDTGDFGTAETIQIDIDNELQKIQQLSEETDEYKRSVNELMGLWSNLEGKKAPMLFNSQSEYDHVQKLKAEIADLQSQIANFNGSDADLEALNGRLTELNDELNKSEISAAQNAANLGSLGPAAADASNKYYELTNKIKEQKIKVAELTIEHEKAKKAMKEANSSGNLQAITDARTKYDALSQALINARHQLTNYQIEQSKVAGGIKNEAFSINSIVSQLKSSAMSLAGGLGLALGAKEFVGQVVGIRGQFQQLEIAFETMLGSGEKAKELLGQLTETAAKTPFDLQGVAQGAKQLMAYGISADEVNDTLVHLGDIAAGLSLPLGDLVYLYGTTMTQGRMFTQDLRQFMGRGIPIAEELAKIFNTTKENVGALVTAGKVGADEFKQAIMAMSSEGGKFAGLMANQSKTITGQISNIQDSIDVMFNEIGQNSEGIINGTLDVVSSLVENYEKVGKVIAGVVATYGVYKGAVMAVIAVEKIQELSRLAHIKNVTLLQLATDALTKKTAALNATMLTNPYVAVATAAAAVIASMISLGSEQDRVNDAYNRYIQEKNEAIAKEEEHKNKINELINIAENEGLTTDARRSAMLKIMAEYPELFKKYNTEIEALKDIYKWKAAIAEIDGKKSLKDTENELADVEKRINVLEKKGKWSLSSTNSIAGSHTTSRTRTEEEELLALQKRRAELNKIKDNAKSEEYLKNLTGVSDSDLQTQIKERKSLIAKMTASEKKYGKVNKGGATGVFDRKQIEKQIKQLEWEQNRRKEAVSNGSKDFVAEANKAYQKEKEAYDKLYSLSDPKKRAAQKGKIKIGEEEVDVSSPELWKAALDKQKKKMDEAKKAIPGDTSKGIGGKSGTSDATRNAKQLQDQWKHEQEMADLEEKAARAREDASIAAIQNDGERERAEREAQHRRTIEDLKAQEDDIYKTIYDQRKRQWELTHKDSPYENTPEGSKGYGKDKNGNYVMADTLNAEESRQYKAQIAVINAEISKNESEAARRQREIMRQRIQNQLDFLKQYGDTEEQRLAITKDYEQKIEEELDPSKKASLMMQMQEELARVNAEEVRQGINWDAIFQDVMDYDVDFLNTIQGQLEDAIKDGIEKGIDAADLQVFADKLQDVKDAIVSKSGGIFSSNGIMGGSWLGSINSQIQKQNQLESRATSLRNESVRLGWESAAANQENEAARTEWQNAIKNFGEDSEEASDALAKFSVTSTKATNAQKAYTAMSDKATAAEAAAAQKSGAMGLAITDAIIHGVNQNLQSASKMVQEWGIGSDDFQKKFATFAESSQYATDAFDALKSGDIAGVVYNLGNAFSTLGESFGIWSNSNRDEVKKENDKLARAMSVNTEAINRLTKAMENQNPEDAYKSYEQALASMKANEEAVRKTMLNNISMYDHGHSLWYDFAENTGGRGREVAKQIYKELGITPSRDNNFDIGDLVRDLKAEDWEKLFTSTAGQGLMMTLNEVIAEAEDEGNYNGIFQDILDFKNNFGKDAYAELQEQFLQTVTKVSFDSMYDSFVDTLMDMDKSAEDMANDFEGYLRRAIYEAMSADRIKPLLQTWYKAFATAMRSKEAGGKYLSTNEITQLMKSGGSYYDEESGDTVTFKGLEAIRAAGEEMRDAIEELGLYNGSQSPQEQSASVQGMERITTDQAEELIGRMNAGQILWQQGNDTRAAILATLQTMEMVASGNGGRLGEMVTLMQTANSHLSDILETNRKMLNEHGQYLSDMLTQLKRQ